jgi:hypothetical protein
VLTNILLTDLKKPVGMLGLGGLGGTEAFFFRISGKDFIGSAFFLVKNTA